ncbi:TetR/AcrR family transcriptional regulator [Halanaerobium sp. ST460_2HS_T2]|uniref:TetR/AcrR family transcriptional regulator n=1 Tax=Halanaerobium sp. ST460_2HS_T2 TaxID=2183914 RepID=UPI000DF31EEA|nr:TetR/AcrR family transcriptional regulator [Halanaerobium sp. ST460_2HS_T2]RCW52117.1 TetR family transcriptional regulator [Halanaerobium sp. ST460_2HS_T2]
MKNEDLDTKNKIIKVTIDLIREEKDVSKITIRRIAKEAEVAISMINYHFQTKANLINKAVESFISRVISSAGEQYQNSNLSPEEKMRIRLKQAAKFLAQNPGIARVSILNDLNNGSENDNSSQLLKSISAQLKEVYGSKKNELELKIIAEQQLAAIQHIFLRADIFEKLTGMDFFDDQERDNLMDRILDNILGKNN